MVPVNYFAALAGDPTPVPEQGGIRFEVFRHEEDFTSTYNLQMYKYDHETGKALEGARFGFFERFDDKNRVNTERDGAAELYEAENHMPAIIRMSRFSGMVSDKCVRR